MNGPNLWGASSYTLASGVCAPPARPGGAGSNRFPAYRGPRGGDETAIPAGVTASRILEYLSDVAYPASREDLIDYARGANAPDEIVEALERLPERRYASPEVVTETIGMVM